MKSHHQKTRSVVFLKTPLLGVKGNLQLEQIQRSFDFLNNSAGGAGSCQTKEAWLAIESLNAAPFPPQTHGIYINLQFFLAGGNFFFFIIYFLHEEEPRFCCFGLSEERRRRFCSSRGVLAGERPWMLNEYFFGVDKERKAEAAKRGDAGV